MISHFPSEINRSFGEHLQLSGEVDAIFLHSKRGAPLAGICGTVLIVEDDAVSRRLLGRIMTMEDFRVLQAVNGKEALEVLNRECCPDLILMDLSMPTMDGADFIRALKAQPKWSKVKILIISGWDDLAARARDLGADGYIRKPVDMRILQREVGRLFNLQ